MRVAGTFVGGTGRVPADHLPRAPAGQAHQVLDRFAVDHPGGSTSIARALVLDSPPALGNGELTDKGTINQRAVLDNRANLVEALYAREPGPAVICVATP